MAKEIPYEVLARMDRLEIRRYPSIVIAKVSGLPDNDAFSILFDYIQGANKGKAKVPMTAPVISSTKIAMSAPVISGEGSFSFVMPPDMKAKDVPKPDDRRVRIETIPPRTLAVLRFGGRTPEGRVERKYGELLDLCVENGVRVIGSPFLMRYNSPFVPGIFRRNEVAVPVSY